MKKNLLHTVTNIITLSLGAACTLMIVQFVVFESSYDKFYPDSENIVRITSEWFQNGEFMEHRAAAVPGLHQLVKAYPEVRNYARYHKGSTNVVRFQEKDLRFEESEVYYADPEFVEIFSLKFTQGAGSKLQAPNKMIISASTATKYFGNAQAVGESLSFDGEFSFEAEVVGVFEDFLPSSHLAGDFILSLKTKESLVAFNIPDNWIWRSFHTYLALAPNADVAAIENKINDYVATEKQEYYARGNYKVNYYVQALHDIHLAEGLFEEIKPSGNIQTLRILIISGAFLMLIALFNYVNLTTARNLKRGKEVAVRKVSGASFGALAVQYLIESVLFVALSTAIAMLMVSVVFPYGKAYLGFEFDFSLYSYSLFWPTLILSILIIGLISGLYPSVVLSSSSFTLLFRTGTGKSGGNQFLRKSLVAFQFALSMGLVMCVTVVLQQTDHMRSRDLGVRKDNILVINGPKIKTAAYATNLDMFKWSLNELQMVNSMSTVSTLPGEVTGAGRDFTDERGEGKFLKIVRVDYDFEQVLGLELIEGRAFSELRHADDSSLVLNEAAFKLFGFDSFEQAQTSKGLSWRNVGPMTQSPIIGLLKDYYPDAQSSAVPTAFILNRTHTAPWDPEFYIVHLAGDTFEDDRLAIDKIKGVWEATFPQDPFNHFFANDFYNNQFQAEVQLSKIVKAFSVVAILLASIGLIALVSYTNLSRLKEIGIRKVLGSGEFAIHQLLFLQNVKPVLVGTILSAPLFYLLLNKWLESYAYRIQLDFWIAVGSFVLFISLVSVIVLLQSHKTVKLNPTEVIKEN